MDRSSTEGQNASYPTLYPLPFVTFYQCPLCVSKFKIKSDFKVHIKAKHKRQLIMNCFNMDLEIRFNFEFGNTQRTQVECEFCLPHLSQETTLKMQKELSENESKDFIDSIKAVSYTHLRAHET